MKTERNYGKQPHPQITVENFQKRIIVFISTHRQDKMQSLALRIQMLEKAIKTNWFLICCVIVYMSGKIANEERKWLHRNEYLHSFYLKMFPLYYELYTIRFKFILETSNLLDVSFGKLLYFQTEFTMRDQNRQRSKLYISHSNTI